ncbi:MAG TPA: crotonase [Dehalococcoidia bacterium]|nr:crotonase [Dehalococcoidia bacterium]
MRYETLIYQKAGAECMITINRPTVANAINMRLAEELADVCADISHDERIRVVVVTGAGDKAFSVGVDLKESSYQSARLISVAAPIASLKVPVIAAINGDTLDQGLELALACDIRFAVSTARFGLVHIGSGLMPWDGATQRLPRLVGKARAMEMFLSGKSIDAAEALRIGLVNRVVEQEQLMPLIRDVTQRIVSKAPFAVEYAKEAICKGLDLTLEQGLCLEADLYCLLQTTEDRTEGIKAFLEKRPPQFKSR